MKLIAAFGFICLMLGLALLLVTNSHAHLISKVHKGDPAWRIEQKQLINLRHANSVKRFNVRWHRKAAQWITREHRQLQARFVAPWIPTADCETSGPTNGQWDWYVNGLFDGGVQFHPDTWVSNGGRFFAPFAYLATPIQQITIAKRLTYDGWPNCPNP